MVNALTLLFKKLHALLFDFSASDNNRREVEDILLAVLAESKNDADFMKVLRRVIIKYEGHQSEGERRFFTFRRFMSHHERPGDRMVSYRLRAEHLLEDLPRIYGDKKAGRADAAPQTGDGTHDVSESTMKTTKEKTNDV